MDWRPDPDRGVFETLLVLGGRPVELDAHLARLRASLSELFPEYKPPTLDVPRLDGHYGYSTRGTSAYERVGALRVTVAPAGGGELGAGTELRRAGVTFVPLSGTKGTPEAVSLRSLRLAGGLGAHKWVDRSLLDETQAGLPEGALPLIVAADGAVLEASRANVFAVHDGTLSTPPLDGRILPGITRTRVLEIAAALGIETHERTLHRNDLLAADAVFLTGSVRGIEPVAVVDGKELEGNDETANRIATELWRRWKLAATGLKSPEQGQRALVSSGSRSSERSS